jgi:dTDP-3-amino-3,4,6-trideoxy-alpha-D-glucose transaminase
VSRVQVPLFATSLEPYWERVEERLAAVARSRQYILGPEVSAFEQEFAAYLGVGHAVGVANGTDAITIALRALGVRPGDDVVCPVFTFYASAEAIVNAGARPVFCDVEPDTLCVSAETVRPHLSERTAAILAVHLAGNVAPVPELRALGVPVLEDVAQAAGGTLDGVPAGALGDAATFSFFPSKNLPCLGDGGAITTSSDEVAERARLLRFHGSTDKRTHTEVGYDSRLDSIQAAVLRLLLPELEGWTQRRRAVAAAYERAGLGELVDLPVPVAGAGHAYHLYLVRTAEPEPMAQALAAAGVQARGYYRTPVHRQPGMAAFGGGDFPATEEIAGTNLALPMGPDLTAEQIDAVVSAAAARAAA